MSFINDDFLLENDVSKVLYHNYAESAPIIDYHCHINPSEIHENKRFENLAEAWLGGDHYKWRIMRANGVNEELITGNAAGWEKFKAFSQALPRAVGNPVYHWTHLELKRYFDCDEHLTPDTAKEIWEHCNEKLANDDTLRVRGVIQRMHVEVIVTTDDPADSLEWHKKLAEDTDFSTMVLPGWRPDAVLNIENHGFPEYIKKLGEASNVCIEDFSSLKTALRNRIEYFNANGCRACDHGISNISYAPANDEQLDAILKKRLGNDKLTASEIEQYRYALLTFCAKEYARLDWVMELHFGAVRSVNSVMLKELGPDTGYDCVGSAIRTSDLARLFDELNAAQSLPKTLIFSINPADNHPINTLAGCFTRDNVKGMVQQGSAWWFNDTYAGMEQQINCFAETGVLANFVGMLTDSRSFLSYTRHEYFRRILCNILGKWCVDGKCTNDIERLGSIVRDVSYNNAKDYFRF